MTKLTTAIVKRTWNWTFSTSGESNTHGESDTHGDGNNPGGAGKSATYHHMEEEKEEH